MTFSAELHALREYPLQERKAGKSGKSKNLQKFKDRFTCINLLLLLSDKLRLRTQTEFLRKFSIECTYYVF